MQMPLRTLGQVVELGFCKSQHELLLCLVANMQAAVGGTIDSVARGRAARQPEEAGRNAQLLSVLNQQSITCTFEQGGSGDGQYPSVMEWIFVGRRGSRSVAEASLHSETLAGLRQKVREWRYYEQLHGTLQCSWLSV